ncbi:nuclear transport factor 2 family protein [Variovorax fucosicus]|uniref:nuclear transport factor 2 family protein n=1 Tax=Variovorax fucosicus TaxID=3053517 RepID=UPI0025791D78|nr:nuclear transport factor 2 family protein [Variovorax sp. J22G47]MDM0057943.1 nuclear transport factor 2 family protein [Variovorax sp. J22G47]
MTTEEENVKNLREGYERWSTSKGDRDSVSYWMALVSEDELRWRSLADGAAGMEFTKVGSSKQDVQLYFDQLAQDWEMVSYTVHELVAQGDRVVMLGHCVWKNRKTGKLLDTPKADVFRFRNGKIVDFLEFYDTATAIAATT